MTLHSFLSIIILLSAQVICAQSAHKLLREGDKAYLGEDYLIAEENYRKSFEKQNSNKALYNLGNAVYNQNRYEEAIQHYQSTVDQAKNDSEKADALYNLGNAQYKNQQIEEAITSYKNASMLKPNDPDILQNLYRAKLTLQQQNQQQQQQEDQQQQDQKDQQEDQQQEGQQQQNQDGASQEQSEIENNPPESEGRSQPQDLSKEDALKLLEVIENEEKNVQEKLRKVQGNKKKPKKDW